MLKCKAWINILLYNMISMLVVRPSFKINVLNIKQAFHSNYHEGDKVFYIFLLNWKGEKELKDAHEVKWIVHWCFENQRFEDILLGNLDFKPHSRWMCFVRMEITCYRPRYHIFIVCTMMSLHGISLWIPYYWTPPIVLLNF